MLRDKYRPTDAWFSALEDMQIRYNIAKVGKNYVESDRLRKELVSAGVVDLDTQPRWHPVFESVESRSSRLRDI